MQTKILIAVAFLAGVAIASAIWGYYLVNCQIELAANSLILSEEQAKISGRVLNYLDKPDPTLASLLQFSATNHLESFPSEVDYWDRRYPYMGLKQRFASTCQGFQTFLQERQARLDVDETNSAGESNSADGYTTRLIVKIPVTDNTDFKINARFSDEESFDATGHVARFTGTMPNRIFSVSFWYQYEYTNEMGQNMTSTITSGVGGQFNNFSFESGDWPFDYGAPDFDLEQLPPPILSTNAITVPLMTSTNGVKKDSP